MENNNYPDSLFFDLNRRIRQLEEENSELKDENKNQKKEIYTLKFERCNSNETIYILRNENAQLKEENEILREQAKPLNAEEHFEMAEYYFGFAWKDRIQNEWFELTNLREAAPAQNQKQDFREFYFKMSGSNGYKPFYFMEKYNHDERYDDLLTRVQHFYEYIKRMYIFEVPTKEMEELFADFLYIPEDD